MTQTDSSIASVLVIDDTPANLGVVVEQLENFAYRVLIAQDGEEGFERAILAQPDIILLDVLLPGADGFEICRRLKADQQTKDIPVIFMTALSALDDKLTGFEVGGVDYITKPLRISEVLSRVKVHIDLRRAKKKACEQNQLLQKHQETLETQVAERTAELTQSNESLRKEIAERKRIQRILENNESKYRSLVENTPDTICRYDRACRRLFVNPTFVEKMDGGRTMEQLLHTTPTEIPGGEEAIAYQKKIAQVFSSGKGEHFELTWKSINGKQFVTYIRLTPEFDEAGRIRSVLAVGRDVTEIHEYKRSIHHLAFFDSLTDLPNKASLIEQMRRAMTCQITGGREGFVLIQLDLDRFKRINDTLGHKIGDQLLCKVADRLSNISNPTQVIARLGGDEFAILVEQTLSQSGIIAIANKIVRIFEQPFHIAEREMFISASLGIAIYPDDSTDIDTLFRYADSAMYHAKKLGRNNFQFYSTELTAQTSERMVFETALRKAQALNEFELYYQPQVHLENDSVIGAEALIRWKRDGTDMISPDKFIPIAEESGLIISIGEWVLETACIAAVKWNTKRATPLKIAVNLSSRQFLQNDLIATMQNVLQKTGCKTEWIKLEITESLLLKDDSEILNTLTHFSEMGFELSIDDFGTGYSSLSYLNRFPVSQIKIDQSFVRDIPTIKDKSELVKVMIYIAQALNLDLIAEGVETEEQANYLKQHGCPSSQGYLFGKPMPSVDFEMWLENFEKNTNTA